MHKAILKCAMGSMLVLASYSASAGWTTSPIEVNAVLQEVPGPAPRCPSQFGGTITGHGDSAVLGRIAFVANDCITQEGLIYSFSKGRFTILTKSGDLLFADYSGQFVPTGEGAKYVFSGASFQITGGTGRYMFATGGGAMQGNEDMMTGAGVMKLVGKISYWAR